MPTKVRAPNGDVIDFPDGMSDAAIQEAMHRNFPPQNVAPDPSTPMSATNTRAYLEGGGKLKPRNFGEDVTALGAGAGQGFGNMALTGQRLVGGGLNRIGLGGAGEWLVNDANAGIAKLEREAAPYKAAHPNIVTAGNIVSTLPVGGVAGRVIGTGARALGAASKAAPLVAALESGGFRTGLIPSAAARAAGAAAPTAGTRVADVLLRGTGGAVVGGAGSAAMNPDEAGTGAAIGAAIPFAGQALGAVGRKVISPIKNSLSPEGRRLVQLAEQNGIDLTPGQLTGSRPLAATESTLTQMPFSSGPQRDVFQNQRNQFNRAVLSKAGVNADTATPEVLDTAFNDIGSRFDAVIQHTGPLAPTPQFGIDIAQTAGKYGRRLDANVAPIFNNMADELQVMANQNYPITPDAYQNIASDLRRTIRQNSSNPALQDALHGLQEALDNLMEANVPQQVADEWKSVRGDYRNLLTIDKAMSQAPNIDQVSGDIPFGSFSRSVAAADKSGFARGRGDLNDLARVGTFLSDRIPNSGTAERSNIINMLKSGGGLAAGIGTGALTGNPIGAVAGAVGGLALPPVLQAFINSAPGKAYLTNQLAGKIPQMGNAELVSALTAALTRKNQEQPQ